MSKSTVNPWDRKLWGVLLKSKGETPLLLGEARRSSSGEIDLTKPSDNQTRAPTRALLFNTRREAKAWCRLTNSRYQRHGSYTVKDWRVSPVRVRELVEMI